MLKAPNYAKDARADVLGWRDRKTGELLEARRHSPEDVAKYEAARELLLEEEHEANRLDDKTKAKLIDIAEEEGAEYSPSWKKADIVAAIEENRAVAEEVVEDEELAAETDPDIGFLEDE